MSVGGTCFELHSSPPCSLSSPPAAVEMLLAAAGVTQQLRQRPSCAFLKNNIHGCRDEGGKRRGEENNTVVVFDPAGSSRCRCGAPALFFSITVPRMTFTSLQPRQTNKQTNDTTMCGFLLFCFLSAALCLRLDGPPAGLDVMEMTRNDHPPLPPPSPPWAD